MSLNPTSSADSSSCVATAMWRSTPARSWSSCSDRLRPTDSGMKIRGKTTVDLSGSTGRREGTAPSTFNAGTSLTFGLSLPPLQFPLSREAGEGRGEGRERRIRLEQRFEPIADGRHTRRRSRHQDAVTYSQGPPPDLRPPHARLRPRRGHRGRRERHQGDRQPPPRPGRGAPARARHPPPPPTPPQPHAPPPPPAPPHRPQ